MERQASVAEGHVQLTASHEGSRTRDLRLVQRAIYGNLRPTNIVDFSTGARSDDWTVELFVRNVFDARGALGSAIQCNEMVCGDPLGATAIGPKIYTYVNTPRTIGIRLGRRF